MEQSFIATNNRTPRSETVKAYSSMRDVPLLALGTGCDVEARVKGRGRRESLSTNNRTPRSGSGEGKKGRRRKGESSQRSKSDAVALLEAVGKEEGRESPSAAAREEAR